jgi:hypothetical protein
MSKKKTKRMTIKEITDAFYSGVSAEKIGKMAQQLVEQEKNKKAASSLRDR